MTAKLIQVYRQILDTADVHLTEDDCVSLRNPQKDGTIKHQPLTIKGDRLVLPTNKQMAQPNWEGRVAFHPLSENTGRGESEVMERLRALLNHRLNTVFPLIMISLLRLGTSPKMHERLNPEQGEFLSVVKNANEKTIADFEAILKAMPAATPTKQFINLGLRRSANIDGKSYFRAGVVHFPFYELIAKGEDKPHGVTIRKKDYPVLQALMDYILPHQGEAHFYSRGSNSRIAPTIDAVMKAMLAVAGPLNDVVERFADFIPQDLLIPTDWAEQFENLEPLLPEIRDLPMLRGNEGHHPQEGAPVSAQAQVGQPAQTPTVAMRPAPVAQPAVPGFGVATQPAPAHHTPTGQPVGGAGAPHVGGHMPSSTTMTNIEDLMRQQMQRPLYGQPQMQPMYRPGGPPQQQGWGQPQQGWGQQQPSGWGQQPNWGGGRSIV